MKASFSTTRRHAFVARSADLRKLWELLQDRVGPVTASAQCMDKIDREFNDLEELASYDNPPSKKIFALNLSSCAEDWGKDTHVDLSHNSDLGYTIRITIKEESDKACSELKEKLSDILDGMKPWYSFLTHWIVGVSFCIIGSTSLLYSLPSSSLGNPVSLLSFVLTGAFVVLVAWHLVKIFVPTWREPRLWSRVFPRADFVLGQEEHRYAIKETLRKGIVGGAVAGVPTMILWAWGLVKFWFKIL